VQLPTIFFGRSSDNLLQRSCVDPDSISWPEESEPDESAESTKTSDIEEIETDFLQEVKKANEAFEEHKTSERGLGRIKKPILRAMCQSRGLEVEDRDKTDLLVGRLMAWVSPIPNLCPYSTQQALREI
jgi:hypothetical protein